MNGGTSKCLVSPCTHNDHHQISPICFLSPLAQNERLRHVFRSHGNPRWNHRWWHPKAPGCWASRTPLPRSSWTSRAQRPAGRLCHGETADDRNDRWNDGVFTQVHSKEIRVVQLCLLHIFPENPFWQQQRSPYCWMVYDWGKQILLYCFWSMNDSDVFLGDCPWLMIEMSTTDKQDYFINRLLSGGLSPRFTTLGIPQYPHPDEHSSNHKLQPPTETIDRSLNYNQQVTQYDILTIQRSVVSHHQCHQ